MDTSDITVGKRYRDDVDEGIRPLCESIEKYGQLQPIVVNTDYLLIGGHRRLRACELLGRQVYVHVAANLTEAAQMLKAQNEENVCREPFKPTEAVRIGEDIEAAEKPKAEERKAANLKQNASRAENISARSTDSKPFVCPDCGAPHNGHDHLCQKGRAADKAAAAVGMSRPTYEKAKAVVAAATAPDAPAEVIAAAAEMDRTGKVDPAYKAVKAAATTPAKPKVDPPKWDITDDTSKLMAAVRKVIEQCESRWSDADRTIVRQCLRQLANEV